MQAQCTQCGSRIQIDDSRVPDRPFKVKCPRCETVLTLPGRTAEPAAAAAARAEPTPAAAPAPAPAPEPIPAPRSQAAQSREERLREGHKDAILALGGPAADLLRQVLQRLGYNVDFAEDPEEGARLLEQGVYEVAVTSRGTVEAGRPETLAQRMLRLSPDTRRGVFVVLVGDEFRTADGTQAWVAQADLVVNPADAGRCESFLRSTIAEKKRLYQPYFDARRRLDAD